MKESVIIINKITKEYYLEKPRTLKKWFKTLFSPFEKFTVIRDFSVIINKCHFVLISGSKGSGKTTLLKLIAGIIEPDKGILKTEGRIVPLIELGAGFNYELTGRENIITNATILGIPKKKIEKIIPKIIGFSELNTFIDVPLKRYSTGMVSRLAFAIAAYSEPDILLLDEVFAVGDEGFRQKTLVKLKEFKKNRVTILLSTNYDFNTPFVNKHINLS